MGARGNKHGQQKRRNTLKVKSAWAGNYNMARKHITERDERELQDEINQIPRRKYSS